MGQCGPESDDLQMDAWGIDVAVSSSTSGVMATAALSLIAMGAGALASLDRFGTDVARPGRLPRLAESFAAQRPAAARAAGPVLGGLYVSTQMILTAGLDAVLGGACANRH